MACSYRMSQDATERRLARWLHENGDGRTPPASVCSPTRWRMFLAKHGKRKFSYAQWKKTVSGRWKCDCFTDELNTRRRHGSEGLH